MSTGFVLPYVYLTTITPANGVNLGFCSSNISLTWDNVFYRGDVGSTPTTSKSSQGLSVDSMDIEILKPNHVSDLAFGDEQVTRGLFAEAKVEIHIEDLLYLPASRAVSTHKVFQGFVGRVQTLPTCYKFELRTQSTLLTRTSVIRTSPFCSYQLGDSNCTKDLISSNLRYTTVTSTAPATYSGPGNNYLLATNLNMPAGVANFYKGGSITCNGGKNLNFSRLIKSATVGANSVITFDELFPYDIVAGDSFTVTAACQKTQDACKVYNNFDNFGAFPTGGGFFRGIDQIILPGANAGNSSD